MIENLQHRQEKRRVRAIKIFMQIFDESENIYFWRFSGRLIFDEWNYLHSNFFSFVFNFSSVKLSTYFCYAFSLSLISRILA